MSSKQRTVTVLVAVLALALGGGIGWWFGHSRDPVAVGVDDMAAKIRAAVKDDSRATVLANAAMARASSTQQKVESGARLRRIGQALTAYARGHGGAAPAKLDELVGTPGFRSDSLVCPRSGCTYMYRGYTPGDPDEHVVAYETGNTDGFVMMLLKSGAAEGCWGERVQKSIDSGLFIAEGN